MSRYSNEDILKTLKAVEFYINQDHYNSYLGIRKILKLFDVEHYPFTLLKEYYEHISGKIPLKQFDLNHSWHELENKKYE